MKELIEYVARSLVQTPDAVRVEVREGPTTVFQLHVAAGELGKVIGRQGRTAKALRTLVGALAQRDKLRATLEIVDPER